MIAPLSEYINRSKQFTCVPAILFDEKNKADYMRFLFAGNEDVILRQYIVNKEIVLLHTMPEQEYNSIQTKSPNNQITHYMAVLIDEYIDKGELVNGNRMIVNPTEDGIDILCFSRENFLLANHFDAATTADAIYFTLYVWKQLRFDQTKDYLYLTKDDEALRLQLQEYISHIN
ncbi:MAG: DUF3822 family protein [Candidatus Symbiothrix sp.]|jgi:hypothetical protein|nr:DUF3822 family protein [Candidatus Symbiothrix sp.]